MDEIKFTIDGQEITAKRGQTVIEAAREAGIYIPYLCWHPTLKAFGACRMCVVQVEKMRGTPASCTTAAMDGMVVTTRNKEIDGIRQDIMDLILSEHPHGCLTCPRIDHCGPQDICLRHANVVDRCVLCPQNERCELQDVVYFLQMKDSDLSYKYRNVPLDNSNPFIDHDMNLCIVCGRCVRACNEIESADAITFIERGDRTLIGTSLGGSLSESGCTFCGACVDVCPVGAITEKDNKWSGGPEKSVTTICSHCSVGCQLELLVKKDKVIRSIADLSGPVNKGNACAKGKFGYKFIHSEDRIKTPLIRKDGEFVKASWDEALSLVSTELSKRKGNAFGAIASPTATNEENYLLQKFVRGGMSSDNIDYIDSSCSTESVSAISNMLGTGAMTNGFREMVDANCILVVGSDMTWDHPVAAIQVKEAVKRGATLIVIDPMDTEIALLANIRLRPIPGSEAILLAGIAKIILDEGLEDSEFIAQNCEGLDDLMSEINRCSLKEVANVTGVGESDLTTAARAYAGLKPGAVFFATSRLLSSGPVIARALANLSLLTGNLGKRASGLNPLMSDANSQGAIDMGCVPSQNGLTHRGMMEGARTKTIRSMFVSGGINFNDMLVDQKSLGMLDFLVVQTLFHNDVTEVADVVLPVASVAEIDGTFTNAERRVQRVNKVIEPIADVKAGWQIVCDLASKMGIDGFDFSGPDQIMEEISSQVPTYGGIRYSRLGVNGLQWPCPTLDHSGTPVLHSDGIVAGKASLVPFDITKSSETTNEQYPLVISTAVLREIKGVVDFNGQPLANLNPEDAKSDNILDGDDIEIITEIGVVSAVARINPKSPIGFLHLTLVHTDVLTKSLSQWTDKTLYGPLRLRGLKARVAKLVPVPAS